MRLLLSVLALTLLFGCQQSRQPGTAKVPTTQGTMTRQLRETADSLLAKGDYATAALKYQQAVNQEPGDLSLRFALGTALSYLNRREETAQQFQWVVNSGMSGSPEVEAARRWLLSAGYPVEAASPMRSAVEPEASSDRSVQKGKVKGRIDWPGIDPHERVIPVRITLTSEGGERRDFTISRRFRLGKAYEFWNIPSGKYRLVARIADTLLWDERLTVDGRQDTVHDLTPANSPVSPKEFPGSLRIDDE